MPHDGYEPRGIASSGTVGLRSQGQARHFVRGLAADGAFERGIEPGDLVTTGTVTRAWPAASGERWTSLVENLDLPGLAIAFQEG